MWKKKQEVKIQNCVKLLPKNSHSCCEGVACETRSRGPLQGFIIFIIIIIILKMDSDAILDKTEQKHPLLAASKLD